MKQQLQFVELKLDEEDEDSMKLDEDAAGFIVVPEPDKDPNKFEVVPEPEEDTNKPTVGLEPEEKPNYVVEAPIEEEPKSVKEKEGPEEAEEAEEPNPKGAYVAGLGLGFEKENGKELVATAVAGVEEKDGSEGKEKGEEEEENERPVDIVIEATVARVVPKPDEYPNKFEVVPEPEEDPNKPGVGLEQEEKPNDAIEAPVEEELKPVKEKEGPEEAEEAK
uniref:Protein TsetseEP-like n=1 Tax=Nicotiana tabacum TaxID=4097 RepID=A0A1S3YVM9_TOBAC|nr:PREDICTED: protein TsetseEP-like [Nicotiana tabacum]